MTQPPMRNGSQDDFQTPKEAIKILLPYIRGDWTTIWECASGKGNLTMAFLKEGFNVVPSDILTGEDFLTWKPDKFELVDMIVTNPPYSLKEKFLERCYEIGKPFALLMPLTALESEKRQKLYRKYGGIQLIIPNRRYNFETPSGKGSGSWFATAWFCGNMNLPRDIIFVNINGEKQ